MMSVEAGMNVMPVFLVRAARHWRGVLEVTATLLVIAVCVDLLLAIGRTPSAVGAAAGARSATGPKPPAPRLPVEPLSIDDAPMLGARTARAALLYYSDFQCPFCGRFATETLPAIQKQYVDTGAVRLVFWNLPLEAIHPFALKAAEGAECAARQQKFWGFHDVLFQHQKQLDDGSLRLWAQAAHLDLAAFDTCLSGQATARVKQDESDAKALGITGTPTFLLGMVQADGQVKVSERLSGALPFERFQTALDKLLGTGAGGGK